jgi:hypothetical protein
LRPNVRYSSANHTKNSRVSSKPMTETALARSEAPRMMGAGCGSCVI